MKGLKNFQAHSGEGKDLHLDQTLTMCTFLLEEGVESMGKEYDVLINAFSSFLS